MVDLPALTVFYLTVKQISGVCSTGLKSEGLFIAMVIGAAERVASVLSKAKLLRFRLSITEKATNSADLTGQWL